MDLSEYRLRESLTIDASAEEIYDLLADISAMGRWSPVCTGGRYDADDHTWFTGDNAIGEYTWQTRCRVVAAERGREFAFVNHGIDGQHGSSAGASRCVPSTPEEPRSRRPGRSSRRTPTASPPRAMLRATSRSASTA